MGKLFEFFSTRDPGLVIRCCKWAINLSQMINRLPINDVFMEKEHWKLEIKELVCLVMRNRIDVRIETMRMLDWCLRPWNRQYLCNKHR